jgi:type VI secretion system protein ImpH
MNFDRPEDDHISRIIKALSGIPPVKQMKLGTFSERSESITLSCAQHFSFQLKNRFGLLDMLRSIFPYPIDVFEFVTDHYDIPQNRWVVLGDRKTSVLGRNMQIGRTMVSMAGNFEIRIGPVSFDQYNNFMMGHAGFDLLTEAVNLYLDRPLAYRIVFIITSAMIPPAQVGFDLENETYEAARLGYTCWIGRCGEDEVSLKINASRLILKRLKEKKTAKKTGRKK